MIPLITANTKKELNKQNASSLNDPRRVSTLDTIPYACALGLSAIHDQGQWHFPHQWLYLCVIDRSLSHCLTAADQTIFCTANMGCAWKRECAAHKTKARVLNFNDHGDRKKSLSIIHHLSARLMGKLKQSKTNTIQYQATRPMTSTLEPSLSSKWLVTM